MMYQPTFLRVSICVLLLLSSNVDEVLSKTALQAKISAYPGTNSFISGTIAVTFGKDTDDLTYKYYLKSLESNVTEAGTHIHTGTTCSDASLVGGHYWDAGTSGTDPDPWTSAYGAVYSTDEKGVSVGSFGLDTGYGFDENIGHAVVVHASDGSRVGCGVLEMKKKKKKKLQACVLPYPGTTSTISGKIAVTFNTKTNDLSYVYRLRNIESSVEGGTHIHTGTTCSDASLVGGHYWDAGTNGTDPDPWTSAYGAVYNSNKKGVAVGSFYLNTGYGFKKNIGHAVVVHASDGSRVGCGVLGKGKATCGKGV